LQIDAIAEGYDPTIGIMHEGNNGSAGGDVPLDVEKREAGVAD
jgi:hypothetical protein